MLTVRDTGTSAVSGFRYYYYEPTLGAAALFTVLFGVATILHLVQMLKTRTWFLTPFVIGGAFETVGYIGRILSAKQNPGPYTEGPYIFQTVLLLVAPAVLAASIYMELGRIVLMLHADSKLFIRRTWLTKIFVAGDVFSFFLQACGAGLQASGKTSTINTGKDVLVGGLFLQVIVFGLFVVAAAVFHKRIKKAPTPKCSETQWSRHMFGLYLISLLIFARSIVRVVEFLQGFTGYIITHEAFLYVFDGLLMFLAVAIMLWVHPSEVTKEIRAVRTASAEIDYIPVEQGQGAIKMDRVAA